RLMPSQGVGIWALVVAAGLSHIVQAAAFELQRADYNQWARGKAFAPGAQRAARGPASPSPVLRWFAAWYAAVQSPFHPIDNQTRARLRAFGSRDGAHAVKVAEAYDGAFRQAVLRWSWESANNRTIAIFIACLVGRPTLYFLLEVFVLNAALAVLVR